MSYDRLLIENLRLSILQILQEAPDYAHNEYVLDSALQQLRIGISTDQLRGQLAWLDEQGLIRLASVDGPGMAVRTARLTRRGEDAALGHARIPGVARPRPEG